MRAFARLQGEEVERFPDGKPLIYQSLRLLRVWDILITYWAENRAEDEQPAPKPQKPAQ